MWPKLELMHECSPQHFQKGPTGMKLNEQTEEVIWKEVRRHETKLQSRPDYGNSMELLPWRGYSLNRNKTRRSQQLKLIHYSLGGIIPLINLYEMKKNVWNAIYILLVFKREMLDKIFVLELKWYQRWQLRYQWRQAKQRAPFFGVIAMGHSINSVMVHKLDGRWHQQALTSIHTPW